MLGEDLRFTSGPVVDRKALLIDAAGRVDALQSHLGERSDTPADDGYGNLLRALAEDSVDFAPQPDLYPIPIPGSSETDAASVQRVRTLDAGYTFWWMKIPLLLFPRRNWAFTRLEVRIEFNPDENDPRNRPKAYDILPNRRFDTIMKAGTEVTVKLAADAHFSIDTGNLQLPTGLPVSAGAGMTTDDTVGAKIDFGVGVKYNVTAARVDHTSEGLPQVFWRLDGAEFFQEPRPDLIVILQVPKAGPVVEMRGVLQAYRRFNMFPAGLQTLIRELPQALRAFFDKGAPIQARTSYNLGTLGSASARSG
jgi:hypothetical protein